MTIAAQAQDYRLKNQEVELHAGENKNLDFDLEVGNNGLGKIVVSGTPTCRSELEKTIGMRIYIIEYLTLNLNHQLKR